jgi:hypothetical protein
MMFSLRLEGKPVGMRKANYSSASERESLAGHSRFQASAEDDLVPGDQSAGVVAKGEAEIVVVQSSEQLQLSPRLQFARPHRMRLVTFTSSASRLTLTHVEPLIGIVVN